MSEECLIIIENVDKDTLGSFILLRLSNVILNNPDILYANLVKGTTENTKSEINLALQIMIDIGQNVAVCLIYDYLKSIFKSSGKRQRCRFKIKTGEVEENIEFYLE